MFPKQVGRFEIIDQVGDNERGSVFRAFDPQLQREVAVKLIKSQHLYTLTAERIFKEEAAKIRTLNHPAILPVYDEGDEDNRPFIAMSLMPGGNLLDYLKKNGPLPLAKAVEIFSPLADALDYAASQGILHLDLKPNNILFDQHGHPFLADLGLVQLIDALTTAKPPMTNSGYISPEQVRGYDMDSRLHVYSLGAILFEALTGQPLFSGVSEMVTAFKHVSEQPRRPSSLRPELPESVDAVLLKALEKDANERYPSARELLGSLERTQGGGITPERLQQERERQPFSGENVIQPGRGPGGAPPATGWTFERDTRRRAGSVNRTSLAIVGVISVLSLCVLVVGISALVFVAALPSSSEVSATETASAFNVQAEATRLAFQENITLAEASRVQAFSWPVVIDDSFDANLNAWTEDEMDDEELASISWSIQNGQYIWETTAKQGFVWRIWPGMDPLSDFYVSVDIQRTSGFGDAQYGVIFRNSDELTTYYYLEVSERQEFAVYLYEDGWATLFPATFSSAILPGQVNHLEVVGQGSQFLFFINGEYVGEVHDTNLSSGEVGLAVGLANGGDEATFVFDNFVVRAP